MDDDGVVAPQLQNCPAQAAGDHLGHAAAHAGRTGERNEWQAAVAHYQAADLRTTRGQHEQAAQPVVSQDPVDDVLERDGR